MKSLSADFSLRPDQWHLLNSGQTGGTAGIDINVLPVWKDYTGTGVKVVVFDTGIDIGHPDLIGNYLRQEGFEFTTNTPDGSYTHVTPHEAHGTFVSGLISADGTDSGLLGVAFGSQFTSYVNFNGPDYHTAFARAADAGFDVMNNSWGVSIPFYYTFNNMPHLLAATQYAVETGRAGLGLNIVFAAGNSYSSDPVFEELGFIWSENFPFAETNTQSLSNTRFTITVASVDHDGTYARPGNELGYTTPGASILVSAPGTDITSTDIRGDDGYGPNDFVTGSGTSYAAPIVSGVVALMLEANPNLGYRDVQEILAYSARMIDPEEPAWAVNGATNHNGGGLLTNYNYGFGMVDAAAAVRLAETWTKQSVYANEINVGLDRSFDSVAIPDLGRLEYSFELADGVNVESIELDIQLRHEEVGDLTLLLTSPTGTVSTLLYRTTDGRATEITKAYFGAKGTDSDLTNLRHTLTSTDFLGEGSGGIWTVQISDDKAGDTGHLHALNLRAFGAKQSDDQTYIYTNDFSAIAREDDARTTLSNGVGTHTLNLAAITDGVTVDLASGTANLAGTEITITADTKIGTIFTGDGTDYVTLSSAGETVSLGRGNDVALVTSKGTVFGGAGFDRIAVVDMSEQYAVEVDGNTITLSHKTNGTQITSSEVQFFSFGEDPADILILTESALEAQLARLYDLVLGRAADFDGLAYWIDQALDGIGLDNIVDAFAASSEFAGLSANLANDAFLDLAYTYILRRDADEHGAQYWLARIDAGADRGDIIASLALSDEAAGIVIDHVRLVGADSSLFSL